MAAPPRGSRGFSYLQTLAGLVVVIMCSMLVYASVRAGLLYGGEAKANAAAGYATANKELDLRGSVIAMAGSDAIEEISFHVSSDTGIPINVSHESITIRYQDTAQDRILVAGDFIITPVGNADSDDYIEAQELHQVKIFGLQSILDPDLTQGVRFSLDILSENGDTLLQIERSVPVSLDKYMDLK